MFLDTLSVRLGPGKHGRNRSLWKSVLWTKLSQDCHSFLPSVLQLLVSHIILKLHNSLKANHSSPFSPCLTSTRHSQSLTTCSAERPWQATTPVFPVRVYPVSLCMLSLGKSTPITIKRQRQKACISFRCLEPCPCHHSEH